MYLKKYEPLYKEDSTVHLKRDSLQNTSEDFDSVSALNLKILEIKRNIREQRQKNQSTEKANLSLYVFPLSFIPHLTHEVPSSRSNDVNDISMKPVLLQFSEIFSNLVKPVLSHNILKYVQFDPAQDLQEPVETEPNHNAEEQVYFDQSFNIRKPSEVNRKYHDENFQTNPIHDFIKLTQVQRIKEPTKNMLISNLRKQATDNAAHIFPNTVRLEEGYYFPKPVQLDPTNNLRKPVQLDPSHNLRKPVQLDPSHNLRNPVELDPSQNLRKPVQLNPTHNMRKPVNLNPTHNLRKPVQLHSTHKLRRPVKLEPRRSLRKPIKLMETHDLRWPVLEESDHSMQNPMNEADMFRSSDADGKLMEIIKGNIHKGSKTSFINDPLHELLYEDEFLMLKCSPEQVIFNLNRFSFGQNLENAAVKSRSVYKKIFNESIEACGTPFKDSPEVLRNGRKLTKWPWMVSLQQYIFNKFWHRCAGSLLNNLWVITAAHCVESTPKWDFLLQLGVDGDSRNYIERFVERISIHPKFNVLNLDHDIALLRMDAPVIFQNSIVPICLPWRPDEIENKKAIALGWRLATEPGNDTDDLSQEKTAPVLTNKECEVMFSETGRSESIQKSFLCTSFQNRRQDYCVGDSGGPLVIFDDNGRWILAGLYSWGMSCRTPNQPEVYIRISGYAKWIEDTILCYEDNINLHEMD